MQYTVYMKQIIHLKSSQDFLHSDFDHVNLRECQENLKSGSCYVHGADPTRELPSSFYQNSLPGSSYWFVYGTKMFLVHHLMGVCLVYFMWS